MNICARNLRVLDTWGMWADRNTHMHHDKKNLQRFVRSKRTLLGNDWNVLFSRLRRWQISLRTDVVMTPAPSPRLACLCCHPFARRQTELGWPVCSTARRSPAGLSHLPALLVL